MREQHISPRRRSARFPQEQRFLVRIATAGMSGKLLVANIPELVALHDGLELLRAACAGDALGLSRAWLVLRGVRGLHGVSWLAQWLQRRPDCLRDGWAGEWRLQLLDEFDEHTTQYHGGNARWSCHNEGRHAALCGRHFLVALAAPEGFDSVSEVARRVRPHMQKLLDRDEDFMSHSLIDVAAAVQGTLVLATQPIRRAGAYNAMDFARGLGAWALGSGRLADANVSERVWDAMVSRQHLDTGDDRPTFGLCDYFGLGTARSVNCLLEVLRVAARPLDEDTHMETISWIGLLAFLCEVRQTLRHPQIGRAGIERVLKAPRVDYIDAALRLQRQLRERGTLGGGCYQVMLFRAALDALST